jgi:hypothetical protein
MGSLRKAKLVLLVITPVSLLLGAREPAQGAQRGLGAGQAQSLDFETYRTRVEPIFLKQRQGGLRCYDCHSVLSTRLRLEPLLSGASS